MAIQAIQAIQAIKMSSFTLKPTINPYTNRDQLKIFATNIGFGTQEEYQKDDKVEYVVFMQSSAMDNKQYDNSYDCYRILQGIVTEINMGKHTKKILYTIIPNNNGLTEQCYKDYMRPIV